MALSILLLLRWVLLIITLFIAPLTATLSPQPYRTRIGVILDLFGGFRVLGVVSLTVEGVLKHQSRPTTTSIVVLLLLEDAVRAVQVCPAVALALTIAILFLREVRRCWR